MRILKSVALAAVVGIILAGLSSQFTTSKYPPCDLVSRGIGVSTYGCSNTAPSSSSPCVNIPPNTAAMATCIEQNYYKYKTYPFGFAQRFGPSSNLIDPRPADYNRMATFAVGFAVSLPVFIYITGKKARARQA